jgi:enoyl-CoA hydratase
MTVRTQRQGGVTLVTIDRPDRRNAVDGPGAVALTAAFTAFDRDDGARVAVLAGAGGTFCAGSDLKAMAAGEFPLPTADGPPPLGPTRLRLTKPVIAAIEGGAFGGGMELALWCDLRIAANDAELGLLNLPRGLPCLDGASVRLPRLVGHGRALELLLTGRRIPAEEALGIGLVNRLAPPGTVLAAAIGLAQEIAALPQAGVHAARDTAIDQWSLSEDQALLAEARRALTGARVTLA